MSQQFMARVTATAATSQTFPAEKSNPTDLRTSSLAWLGPPLDSTEMNLWDAVSSTDARAAPFLSERGDACGPGEIWMCKSASPLAMTRMVENVGATLH